ncbi:hypothetical protein CEUSTIGMA_g9423.t1 [Chlamydomonas eustigma]|uniref:G-patch domain-containing protein n=1 Tax=Chlamydomonas eustigma TaxID=1157962 RepID=A0A250XFY9_9CHLO|nr:hypothetical protein CEUSTIGMA_g9423.t1 [Chlamydomonas eustigma]|eukprot:GAX81995.1 hypothetical protein CEUSTIGMA_g9423.t1 [Chlamydomonas eustigma]
MKRHYKGAVKLWKPNSEVVEEVQDDAMGSSAEPEDTLDALLDKYSSEAQALSQATLHQSKRSSAHALPGMIRGREEGLNAPLSSKNKGFELLKKMGYQEGQGLGKSSSGRVEPLRPEVRGTRTGLGVHEQKKQRMEQQQQQRDKERRYHEAKTLAATKQYVNSSRETYQVRRAAQQLLSAWRVCEQLESLAVAHYKGSKSAEQEAAPEVDGEMAGDEPGHACFEEQRVGADNNAPSSVGLQSPSSVPAALDGLMPAPPSERTLQLLLKLPFLWRDLNEELEEASRSQVAAVGSASRTDQASLGLDAQHAVACKELLIKLDVEVSSVHEQLDAILRFLRGHHLYCFFCGCAFKTEVELAEMCPGICEEEH